VRRRLDALLPDEAVGKACFPWATRKPCFFSPPMISARVAGVPMPLASFRPLPQNLIVNKAPGILHRLDQSAFVVTRRWSGLLVLDFRIVQLRSLAVIDGLTTRSAEFETTHVERCGCLTVAEVRHQGAQIGPRDDVEQFFLIGRQAGPYLPPPRGLPS
jgi:hypothetical protein